MPVGWSQRRWPRDPGGGDGIAFFLASASRPRRARACKAVRLATRQMAGHRVCHGWLGIGLDAFGTYNSPDCWIDGVSGDHMEFKRRRIGVRGPARGLLPDWQFGGEAVDCRAGQPSR